MKLRQAIKRNQMAISDVSDRAPWIAMVLPGGLISAFGTMHFKSSSRAGEILCAETKARERHPALTVAGPPHVFTGEFHG